MLLAALGLYLFAVHDMQMAKGVGLYLCMETGGQDRRVWDAAADIFRLLSLLGCILFPVIRMKKWNLPCLFRVAMVEMALLPVFDESAFLHFVFDGGISKLCVERNPEWMISRVREWMDYMGVILPILFLLFIMEQKEQKNSPHVTKTGGVMVCIMIALGLIDILIPALGFAAFFVFCYIPVFFICMKAERLLADGNNPEKASLVLYALFWTRVVYRMIFVLETF